MRYRRLGTSGVEVSIIGLGGTVFGRHQTFTHYSDRKQAAALIHHAADLGVNHLDTAVGQVGVGIHRTYDPLAASAGCTRGVFAGHFNPLHAICFRIRVHQFVGRHVNNGNR